VTLAGVSDNDALVRAFHFIVLSFLVASLSFQPIHSQEMFAADAALAGVMLRELSLIIPSCQLS